MGLSVPVLEELRRLGVKFQFTNENWIKVLCPFHKEEEPSCAINCDTRGFKCHGCQAHGDIISWIGRYLNQERHITIWDLEKRYGGLHDRIVEPDLVERYHERLWKAGPLLTELRKRAITDDDIRTYRLGEDRGRITIPIKNAKGEFVNIRRYAPGSKANKITNMSGRGEIRLFPIEQLAFKKLLVTGGEVKAIVGARVLNRHGIGAITVTAGEGNWDSDYNAHFDGKDTYICLDIDESGQKAASRRCAELYPFASWIGNVKLDLDPLEWPRGGLDDYVAQGGDLLQLIERAETYKPSFTLPILSTVPEAQTEIIKLPLQEACTASYGRKKLEVRASVIAADQSAYLLPKTVKVQCDKSQDLCGICPIFGIKETEPVVTIHPESEPLLAMVAAPTKIQNDAVRLALNIPICKSVTFETVEFYHGMDLRLSHELSVDSNVDASLAVPTLSIDSKTVLNEVYHFTGTFVPHPKTQVGTFIVSEARPAVDALSSFKLQDPEELDIFKPEDDSDAALESKLDEIYDDLEERVTRVYGRRDLHQIIDLAYHSALFLPLKDGRPTKGWVEVLILGDSSQAKSECVKRLIDHYGLGESVDSKNATTAGLIGGLQQFGGKWFATWGLLAKHDRRLIVLDELKGMKQDVFAKLTDVRSSGIADLTKIERLKTWARCRLIALTNPLGELPMSAYNFGIEAVRELIKNPEDIRRFDACLILNKDDVDVSELQRRANKPATGELKFTAEKCRKLILWAWTRQHTDIHFSEEALELLSNETIRMCERFSDAIPIVDRGSMRFKIARLSTALAARIFSARGNDLLVGRVHVQFVSRFLERHYESRSCGYAEFSDYMRSRANVKDGKQVSAELAAVPFARELRDQLINTTEIELQDIMDWTGWDRNEALPFVSSLVRNQCLIRFGRGYRKTPQFIELLQSVKLPDVPEHIKNAYKKEEF